MLQVYSLMFTYNKIIENTDTGVPAAVCRRLGKHKYAVRAMFVGQRSPAGCSIMVGHIVWTLIRCVIILAARLGVRNYVEPEKTGAEAHRQRE